MHAANWTAVSGQTNVYKYENFDFPIDEDSSDYVQVYRNGVEQLMGDYAVDGYPDADLPVVIDAPENQWAAWRVYVYSENNPASTTALYYTADYYWNGEVLREELDGTWNSTTLTALLEHPCNSLPQVAVYERDTSGNYYQCGVSGGTICSASATYDNANENITTITVSNGNSSYDYYATYTFDGLGKSIHQATSGQDSEDYWPDYPITHLGPKTDPTPSDSHRLIVSYSALGESFIPLDRCASDEVSGTSNNCLVGKWSTMYQSGATAKAAVLNVGSGKGAKQTSTTNDYAERSWYLHFRDTGYYRVIYFTDMDTNVLPLALGRGDDIAALGLDRYVVYYPNLACEDYLSETYDKTTCKTAIEGTNTCSDLGVPKCLSVELDPEDWVQSMYSRYFQYIEDEIYVSVGNPLQNQIIDAVYATRNGVEMIEKSTISEFTSAYEVVFACIDGCGTTNPRKWRVYIDNGVDNPGELVNTMHAYNPWSLDATSNGPDWLDTAIGDEVTEDIFTVLYNLGFESTAVSVGSAEIIYDYNLNNYRDTIEDTLFGDQPTVLEGFFGAMESQGDIGVYLHHTLFAYWDISKLGLLYDLDGTAEEIREDFWIEDNVWDGTIYYGILGHFDWMLDIVDEGNSNHAALQKPLLGLELDFESTITDDTNLGDLFFEPFYSFDTTLLEAIEQRGFELRKEISTEYPWISVLCYFNEEMFINPAVQAFIHGLTTYSDETYDYPVAGGIHIFTSSSYHVPYSTTRSAWEEQMVPVGKGSQEVLLLTEAIDDDPQSQSDWDLTGGMEWGSSLITWWDISYDYIEENIDWNYTTTYDQYKQNWLAYTFDNHETDFIDYLETQMVPYCDRHLVFPLMNYDLLWLYPKGLSDRGADQNSCSSNNWIDCDGDIWPWTVGSHSLHTMDEDGFYQVKHWNGSADCPCQGYSGVETDWGSSPSVDWRRLALRGRWGVEPLETTPQPNCGGDDDLYDSEDFYCGDESNEPPTADSMNEADLYLLHEIYCWTRGIANNDAECF